MNILRRSSFFAIIYILCLPKKPTTSFFRVLFLVFFFKIHGYWRWPRMGIQHCIAVTLPPSALAHNPILANLPHCDHPLFFFEQTLALLFYFLRENIVIIFFQQYKSDTTLHKNAKIFSSITSLIYASYVYKIRHQDKTLKSDASF